MVSLHWGVEKKSGNVFAVSGVSIRLFTLGSASRGMPHREWEIQLPLATQADYNFDPCGDVIAFVGRFRGTWTEVQPHYKNHHFKVILIRKRYIDSNLSKGLIRRQTSSRRAVPNASVLADRCLVLRHLLIHHELQACCNYGGS